MICPRCNAPVEDGSAFCLNCGTPMTAPQQAQQQPQQPQQAQQQPQQPQQAQQPQQEQPAPQQGQASRICPYCNSIVADASPFCTTCGAQMPAPAQNQQYYAPNQQYYAPNQQYGAPNQQYGAPNQQYYAPNQQYNAPMYPAPQPKNSGKAIASLVLSLVSILITCTAPVCGILSIIFGALALKDTAPNKMRGRGMAMAGLIVGIISVIIAILYYFVLIPYMIENNILYFYYY